MFDLGLHITLAIGPVFVSTSSPGTSPDVAPADSQAECLKLDYRARVVAEAESSELMSERVQSEVERSLQYNDIMLSSADGTDIPLVNVLIRRFARGHPQFPGWGFTINIVHADSIIKDGASVGECLACTESEVLEKIAGAARSLTPKLRAYITDNNNKPCPSPADADTCRSDEDCSDRRLPLCSAEGRCKAGCRTDADCRASSEGVSCDRVARTCVPRSAPVPKPEPPPLNGLQRGGIGLTIVGGLGVSAGAALVGTAVQRLDDVMLSDVRSMHIPGVALLAVGGAATLTGIVMFFLGRERRRYGHIVPIVETGTGGVFWTGRF